ncbi:Abi family protein, partial [Acinetobacter baumannii]|uniref:Abi family protein n=2 Tax=Acinetobacter TaxID=469 RepID=UPI0018DE2C69
VDLLSSDRLKSYKLYFNLNSHEECIGVYLWNDALSTAFFKLLSIFEVAFRNMVHKELSCLYSTHKTQGHIYDNDWYMYLMDQNILTYETQKILKKMTHMKKKVKGVPTLVPKTNNPPTPGKVIANQTFGFWVKLIELHPAIDWSEVFFKGFKDHFAVNKSYWDKNAIDDLIIRLRQVLSLRNRIAHHEPLWKFTEILHEKSKVVIYESATTPSESISRMLTLNHRLCRLIGWISKDRRDDYLSSSYKRHFDWFCQESTIEIYKNYSYMRELPLSRAKREFRRLLKISCLIEIKHQHGGMVISRGF